MMIFELIRSLTVEVTESNTDIRTRNADRMSNDSAFQNLRLGWVRLRTFWENAIVQLSKIFVWGA